MEHAEIMNLWKAYDKKLDESLTLNRKNAEDITKIKIRSLLASMAPVKIFTVLVGILWVIFIDTIIINVFPYASATFLASAIIQVITTKLAIGIYLYQLILCHNADTSEAVLATQEKLSALRSSTLWAARILFLQLPVWTTFYWTDSMLQNGDVALHIVQFIITALFTYLAIWLFINIKYENRDKKWFRLIFNGQEWEPVMKSMELLEEVEEFKIETRTGTY
ncbi:MAG: hypothetical protein EOP54_17035 [Sphingobacteriales bacterium]|nr:MAG: hypothetical protein EOP54_17035 [Sphingobacteriales bacterium]